LIGWGSYILFHPTREVLEQFISDMVLLVKIILLVKG
jgi:hypothetical protein